MSEHSPPANAAAPTLPSVEVAGSFDDGATTLVALSRVESLLIVTLTLAAGLLRFAKLDELAIEHFDEGVYASNLWFPDSGFKYPDQHLFAPPLVPSLIEWSILICGEQSWASFLPSLLLGTLTVPLVWWIGRNWFGSSAGIASACLVALSDFHIAMSRSALTDVTLSFFLIAAVGLLHAAVTRDRLGLSLLAGLATGLAWSAKYNGWLALAIAISGTIAAIVVARFWLRRLDSQATVLARPKNISRNDKRTIGAEVEPEVRVSFKIVAKHLAVTSVVACIAWYPVFCGLQDHGGYSAVAKNHQQYVVGLSGWWPSLVQHESVQRHYAGWMTWLGGMLAVVCAVIVRRVARSTWNVVEPIVGATNTGESPSKRVVPESDLTAASRSTWNMQPSFGRVCFVMALAGAIVLSPVIVFLMWSMTTMFAMLLRIRRSDSGTESSQLGQPSSFRWLALWLSLAWMTGLLLATPMYRPYPRLLLPFLSIGWIVAGAACVMLLFDRPRDEPRENSSMRWGTIALIFVVCGWRSYRMGFECWQDRSGLATIAEQAIQQATDQSASETSARSDVKFVLYVYGEPGLFFHLPRAGVPTQPIQDLDFATPGSNHARVPTFVLVGPHARKSVVFQEQLREVRDQLELVKSFDYRASNFVLFDDYKPTELPKVGVDRVTLYRVQFE